MEPRTQPRTSVLIAARLITLIVGLAGAEGIFWVGGYPAWWYSLGPSGDDSQYAPDPDLGWKNREGQFDLVDPVHGGASFRYTNWSLGRRATTRQEPRQDASAARALFFGDSYVQGYGLADEQTFAWMVQQNHAELAVSNYGTAAYGTFQSYLAMQKYVRGPASSFYMLNGFHEERNVAAPDWIRVVRVPPPGVFYPFAVLDSSSIREVKSRGVLVWPLTRHLRLAAMVQEYYMRAVTFSRVRNKRAVTQAILLKMNETALAAGGKFTVILFDLTPEQRRDYREFARSHNIHFVDCDFAEMKDRSLRLPDGHPNEKLNRLLARWIEPLPLPAGTAGERAGKF